MGEGVSKMLDEEGKINKGGEGWSGQRMGGKKMERKKEVQG